MKPGYGNDQFNDFSFGVDKIRIDAAFGFADAKAVLVTVSKPFSNLSKLTLNKNTSLDIVHDVQSGKSLTADDIVIVDQTLSDNQAPVASGDTATTTAGEAVTVDVLANDSDTNGDALSIQSSGNPGNGTISITETDALRYFPDANFSGTDEFTYTVSDGNGGTDNAMVTVEVADDTTSEPPEQPPQDQPLIGENDDFELVQHTSPGVLGAGAGEDTYILASSTLNGGEEITITDVQGTNRLQLVEGLEIAESLVASDTLRLVLANGSEITVLGAGDFGYEAGANAVTGETAANVEFSAFVSEMLGVEVPASGVAEGGSVTIGETQNDNANVAPAPLELAGVADTSMVEAAIA